MKKVKKIGNFTLQFILWLVSWILQPIIELATFIVVATKYKLDALNYFDGKGLEADFRSARDNRSLWNWLFLTKKSYKFTRIIDKTISRMLGVNSKICGGLSIAGWVMYYFLYVIDFTNWKNGGHCVASLQESDFEIINKYNGKKN